MATLVFVATIFSFVLFLGTLIFKALRGDYPSFYYALELLTISLMTSFSIITMGIYPVCLVVENALTNGGLPPDYSLPLIVGGLVITSVSVHRYYIFVHTSSKKINARVAPREDPKDF
jgi:hypothetical protein